jgi:hypothetical protein
MQPVVERMVGARWQRIDSKRVNMESATGMIDIVAAAHDTLLSALA